MRALLLAIAFVLLATSADSGQEWSGIDQRIGRGIVRVLSQAPGEPQGSCSGAVINSREGYVLTAAHCIPVVSEGRSVTVDSKHATVQKVNYLIDLAVLRVDGLRATSLSLRTDPIHVGLAVATAGYAFGANQVKYTFGHVSDRAEPALFGVSAPPWIADAYFIDAKFIPGHSGGVVVDAYGQIAGVVQARLSTIGLAAPPHVIKSFAGSLFEITPR